MRREMSDMLRVIMDGPKRGAANMAADYAVLLSVSKNESPATLRIYRWRPPAVTIGYFQSMRDDVRRDECEKDGIDVIRRITGGGAVFHEHEITYSLCVPLRGRIAVVSVLESYRLLCSPVIAALRQCGIDAHYSPVNDIVAGGGKISGCAQTRRDGVLLQHGTILLDVNFKKMFRYLNVPPEKSADGGSRARVTSIRTLAGGRAMDEHFIRGLEERCADEFALLFDADIARQGLSGKETECAAEIERDVFGNERWNRERKATFL